MPRYSPEIQHLLYEDENGVLIGLDEVQRLDPVPIARLAPVRALLAGPDEYLGYQAALVLTAWGDAAGLHQLEQFINTRLDQRLAMAPHRIYDYDNGYDEMAGAVYCAGLASAAGQPARRRVLGKLLALYGPCQFEGKLKAALLRLDWAAELVPDMRAALARALALGRAELAARLLPPLARCEGRAARALLGQFAPRSSGQPFSPTIYADIVEALSYLPAQAVDAPAVRAIMARIRLISWQILNNVPQSQVRLMREYLRRAALVAQLLNRPGVGGGWPWFDAAARVTLPGAGQRELPGIEGHLLPGYTLLDKEPDYWGPGTDPLEEEVLALNQHLHSGANRPSMYMRSVLLWAVRWAALKDHPALAPLHLPDLYEPLLVLMERGGWWRMEHGDHIEFQDLTGIGVSSIERMAQFTPMPTLDPPELDRLDAIAQRADQAQQLLKRLAQVAVLLKTDYDAVLQPPITDAALGQIQARTRAELGAELPDGYLSFLRTADGLNWNGRFFYASQRVPLATEPTIFTRAFVETNREWRGHEPYAQHLFFAEGEDRLYAYNESLGRYEILDRATDAVLAKLGSAEELLATALQEGLMEDKAAKNGAAW